LTRSAKFTRSAAAFGAATLLAGAAAGCGSSSGSNSSSSAAPAKLVVWRMGSSVPSQVTWMNGVVAQFHQKYPGTYGLGAPSNFTNGIVSFIWGAGGQVAVQQGGKWKAELNSPQSEAGLKFYADLLLTQHVSPAKYVGQTELGAPGATSGGANEDFAKGTLDMYMDGPWALSSLTAVSKKYQSDWASFPIPSRSGPNPAPAFAGGSDLAVWAASPNKTAAWDLITVMNSPSNATTFASLQGFFPEFTSALAGGKYSGSPVMAGFAKAAAFTQISPLNSKNWATADATDAIIPTMMKALMKGAPFAATVSKANAELEKVLNTGSQ
jgi:ABC-type glycerol-3-phosphate transport system substrate-binding protein